MPSPWDPFAGDYVCKDGWIRFHTNYSYHREAVFKVLGKADSKTELSKKVFDIEGDQLEQKVLDAGGCAAKMRCQKEWAKHIHGRYASREKILSLLSPSSAKAEFSEIKATDQALEGVRVLDLTRVIAGPTCTKFLSAHGAAVLRIDPFGFEEVAALLPETTVGKKRAFLNFSSAEGKSQLERLIREAHVIVLGFRPDALTKLGFNFNYFKNLNPSIVVATLDAYGWDGPWQFRRGFDSLVQMSTGIAAEGAKLKGGEKPFPLPVQALDHSTGYLLAAGICRALTELYQNSVLKEVRSSLVGAANILQLHRGDFEIATPDSEYFESTLVNDITDWGNALRVFAPGTINGVRGGWKLNAGPLGADKAVFNLN